MTRSGSPGWQKMPSARLDMEEPVPPYPVKCGSRRYEARSLVLQPHFGARRPVGLRTPKGPPSMLARAFGGSDAQPARHEGGEDIGAATHQPLRARRDPGLWASSGAGVGVGPVRSLEQTFVHPWAGAKSDAIRTCLSGSCPKEAFAVCHPPLEGAERCLTYGKAGSRTVQLSAQ